ncbi:MAG: hypothetical protein OXG92_15085 [Chloroflexi bacterium]|nr:hypothetical protein [Chloroflexota bacterium]MCY3717772.1 hypothetical protein [Chloroflexota bacterium]MDE2651475.1 hypothetical protein [Chloroflexota bacterium]MXX50873.1 hypothetical protein [Chloroflexota bacterium]MYH65093.1 hypothetical protein [Chloroflexota bacterium]
MKHCIDAGTIRRLAMALALLVLLPLPALAATIEVDSNCTLVAAIANANEDDTSGNTNDGLRCEAGSGADTIVLQRDVRASNETLSYEISSDIYIDGRGNEFVGVGSNGFTFNASEGKLTISNAEFTNARSGGEYGVVTITAEGDVTFQNVLFTRSGETGGFGGVTLTSRGGNVKVRQGTFRGNRLSSGSVVSGPIDISRSAFYENHGSGNGYVISNARIRSSTIGENRATDGTLFAVSGSSLSNVTVSQNRGGGVTGGTVKNSILYGNRGPDCQGAMPKGVNWIGDGGCTGGTRTYTGTSPDIDDDFDYERGIFPLEEGADAAGKGADCEFIDQLGRPFGPNPCDLGAESVYVQGSGPRISAPVATAIPTSTSVPDQPTPTVAPVQGWVLYSDRDGIKANEVNAAGIGIAHIIEMGFLTAIDIWSEVGWGVTACHTDYSNGNFEFLDAAGMPRQAVPWPAAPHINGMACTYIETPGTIVLLRADPWQEPATPTPDPDAPVFGPVPLEDCQLITRDMVNLRAEEWGDVLNIIPYETELTASESSEEFFKVTFEEQEGWVHRDWVTITAGDCGE